MIRQYPRPGLQRNHNTWICTWLTSPDVRSWFVCTAADSMPAAGTTSAADSRRPCWSRPVSTAHPSPTPWQPARTVFRCGPQPVRRGGCACLATCTRSRSYGYSIEPIRHAGFFRRLLSVQPLHPGWQKHLQPLWICNPGVLPRCPGRVSTGPMIFPAGNRNDGRTAPKSTAITHQPTG